VAVLLATALGAFLGVDLCVDVHLLLGGVHRGDSQEGDEQDCDGFHSVGLDLSS
jgi:hypothetical protein